MVITPAACYFTLLLASAIFTGLSLPCWRRACLSWGLIDHPGPRKSQDTPMPLAGGLALLTGLLLTLLATWLSQRFGLLDLGSALAPDPTQTRGEPSAWILVSGGIGMTLLGCVDDRCDLRPAWKFSSQMLIASAVVLAGVRLPSVPGPFFLTVLLSVLWIVGVTNALNLTDNMNGLCAGLGLVGGAAFASSAAVRGRTDAAAAAFLMCGALAGFLPWNFPRAQVFLGDAGSHLVGYVLAVLAIWPQPQSPAPGGGLPGYSGLVRALLILAVPLCDLGSVVLIRWRQQRPFYVGDTNHFSHLLLRSGFSPAQAVMILWAIAILFGVAAVLWVP